MIQTSYPRRTRDFNASADLAKRRAVPVREEPCSLIDSASPCFGPYLILVVCLKEESGDISQEEENALWQLIESQGITQRMAMDFVADRRAQRRKRALTDFWQMHTR